MANQGPWTYSDTFWIMSGTSKKATKSGPVDPVFITTTLQQIQEKSQTSLNTLSLHITISQHFGNPFFQNVGHDRASTV